MDNNKVQEVLAERFANLNYGETLTHFEIQQIIGIDYNKQKQKYGSVITSTKKILLKNYRKTLSNIREVGYQVVEPDNYVNHSLRHYKRGFNEFQKGYDILTSAPVEKMSVTGREIYNRVNDRAVLLNASLNGAVVELKILSKNQKRKHPLALD